MFRVPNFYVSRALSYSYMFLLSFNYGLVYYILLKAVAIQGVCFLYSRLQVDLIYTGSFFVCFSVVLFKYLCHVSGATVADSDHVSVEYLVEIV